MTVIAVEANDPGPRPRAAAAGGIGLAQNNNPEAGGASWH
jgi:hypothetical protein